MGQHLAGKVAKIIGDLRTLIALTEIIEHDLEKRIVGRHVFVKIDAILSLLPRLKNEYRSNVNHVNHRRIAQLSDMIDRLRNDYHASDMPIIRDCLVGHGLKLDLVKMDAAWRFMGGTTFRIILDDLNDIDLVLSRIAGANHIPAGQVQVDKRWPQYWRRQDVLADPDAVRFSVVYPGLGNKGIAAPIPTKSPSQDALVRAVGLATFIRQVRLIMEIFSPGSTAERLSLEIMLNDYFALWELLFDGNVRNVYGDVDKCLVEHWSDGPDPIAGAECLRVLRVKPHSDFDQWWYQIRNKVSAHVDPDIPIWNIETSHWPMTRNDVINEALRVIEAFRYCASLDIRTKVFFIPPTAIKNVTGLTNQDHLGWE